MMSDWLYEVIPTLNDPVLICALIEWMSMADKSFYKYAGNLRHLTDLYFRE